MISFDKNDDVGVDKDVRKYYAMSQYNGLTNFLKGALYKCQAELEKFKAVGTSTEDFNKLLVRSLVNARELIKHIESSDYCNDRSDAAHFDLLLNFKDISGVNLIFDLSFACDVSLPHRLISEVIRCKAGGCAKPLLTWLNSVSSENDCRCGPHAYNNAFKRYQYFNGVEIMLPELKALSESHSLKKVFSMDVLENKNSRTGAL